MHWCTIVWKNELMGLKVWDGVDLWEVHLASPFHSLSLHWTDGSPEKCWLYVFIAYAFRCLAGARLLHSEDPMNTCPGSSRTRLTLAPHCQCNIQSARDQAFWLLLYSGSCWCPAFGLQVCHLPWCVHMCVCVCIKYSKSLNWPLWIFFFPWVPSPGLSVEGFS